MCIDISWEGSLLSPCALATVLVGLFGGLIYRLRAGTFISVAGTVAFAALMEAFHMALVLLLARPYSEAVLVVNEVAMPMINANALGIMIFAFMISNKIKELKVIEERGKSAQELYDTRTLERWFIKKLPSLCAVFFVRRGDTRW